MDPMISAASDALSKGDPLAALKRIALRDDPPAVALRGIAMAQLGDLPRALELLRRAARAFGAGDPLPRARCAVAEAEIALLLRDLGGTLRTLQEAHAGLDAYGDRTNAAHAGYLEARHLLLIGRLDEAERVLDAIDTGQLPRVSQVGYELVRAGIAIRQVKTGPARAALERARLGAEAARIPSLQAEVEQAVQAFHAPTARLVGRDVERLLLLEEVERLFASEMLVVDACRNVVRAGGKVVSLSTRPVLFALVRALAAEWPGDVARETLLNQAFGARHADESSRARLRVEIARLREAIKPMATLRATRRGFVLQPHAEADVGVLAPPVESDYGKVLALLSDGEAWSGSALALALNVSPRTVQRALEELGNAGTVEAFGRGRARRWITSRVPGFPTSLLLPITEFSG